MPELGHTERRSNVLQRATRAKLAVVWPAIVAVRRGCNSRQHFGNAFQEIGNPEHRLGNLVVDSLAPTVRRNKRQSRVCHSHTHAPSFVCELEPENWLRSALGERPSHGVLSHVLRLA